MTCGQRAAFREAILRNAVIAQIVARLPELDLPGGYLVAGALAQTVWNVLLGRPPQQGVRDYDLVYFDADASYEAEDRVIQRVRRALPAVGTQVEVRNQARVPLWYEAKFGVPCPPYACTEDAIEQFPTTATSVGVRPGADGVIEVFAPYGLDDVFGLIVRANTRQAPRPVYEAKVARWQAEWPQLTVLPWPG